MLVAGNFKFYFYRDLKKTREECWCCIKKDCRVKLYILQGAFSRIVSAHSHESGSLKILNRQKVSNVVKHKGVEKLSVKSRQLLHEEINKNPKVLTTMIAADLTLIANNINHSRRQMVPNLPKNPRDLQEFLNETTVYTTTGENFLLVNDTANQIVIFSYYYNLSFLCANQEQIYMDGTFEHSANFFYSYILCIRLSKKLIYLLFFVY